MSPPGKSLRSLPIVERVDDAKLRAWLQLATTFQRVSRGVVGVLAGHGVTLPQFDVLATLRFNEGATQQELAEKLLVTKGNVCGLIDRLEGLGWVQRRPDAADARVNRLHLTGAGRAKVQGVMPDHDREVLRVFGGLTGGDVKSLRNLLDALVRGTE